MKMFGTTIGASILSVALAVPAAAQTLSNARLDQLATERGATLRFRQLEGPATAGKGHVDMHVQYDGAAFDGANRMPRIVGRFGVSDRVDLGAWGGYDHRADEGMFGVDAKIALLREGQGSPVTVSIRPSFSSLAGWSDAWVGNASVDLSVGRTFGRFSPYGGVAASSSLALDRLHAVDLDRQSAGQSYAYAGLSYRWKSLLLSGEVENGIRTSFAFRVGTRF